eukprot:1140635-Pelagomonas_calceolata.AAC.7
MQRKLRDIKLAKQPTLPAHGLNCSCCPLNSGKNEGGPVRKNQTRCRGARALSDKKTQHLCSEMPWAVMGRCGACIAMCEQDVLRLQVNMQHAQGVHIPANITEICVEVPFIVCCYTPKIVLAQAVACNNYSSA